MIYSNAQNDLHRKFSVDSNVACRNITTPFHLPHVLETTHSDSCNDNSNNNYYRSSYNNINYSDNNSVNYAFN